MEQIEEVSIIFSDEYREIEARIIKIADELDQTIDRTKDFSEQGMQSMAYEIARKKIKEVLRLVRKEKEQKFKPKKSFE